MIACLFLWPQRSFSSDSSSHSNFLLFFSQSFKLLTLELRHHHLLQGQSCCSRMQLLRGNAPYSDGPYGPFVQLHCNRVAVLLGEAVLVGSDPSSRSYRRRFCRLWWMRWMRHHIWRAVGMRVKLSAVAWIHISTQSDTETDAESET